MIENKPDVEMRDIPGYEGLYAITRGGRVWSYPRSWINGNGAWQRHNGKWLVHSLNSENKRIYFHLTKN